VPPYPHLSAGVEAAPARSPRAAILTATLCVILAPLNTTMIAVALTGIIEDFDVSVAEASWIVTGYLVVLAALQAPGGRLGDRIGRRRAMAAGLLAFGAASVLAALAPSFAVLVVARLAQAAAGAVVFPNAVGLLREALPAARRAAGFGILGGAASLAAAIGPPLGGALVVLGDWHAIFVVNVPAVAVALILVMRVVPPRAAPADRTPPHRGLGLVSTRSFASALGSVALGNVAFYSMIVAVPLLLERATDWSSARVGLALAALTGPAILAAPLGGRIADRAGRRAPAVAGHALVAVSLLPVALAPDGRAALIVGSLAAAGVGVGLAHAALQTAAVEAAVSERAGTAAGLYSTCRYVGSIAGALLFAALIGRGLEGFGALFAVAAGAAACAALVAAGVAPTPARHPLDAAPHEEEGTGAPPADGVK
jgi:MFS family permease